MTTASVRLRGLILPAILAALGFAILMGLGFWQLERRAWKEALIDRIETRTIAMPQEIPAEPEWGAVTAERDEYRPVRATGTFRHEQEAYVYALLSEPKGRFSGSGYWVFTLLELSSGALVIVNRGFVPQDRRDPASRREGQIEGVVTVTGLLRTPEPSHWFTPDSDPQRRLFFTRDPVEIAGAYDLARVAPFTIDADATENPGGLPQGGETRLRIPNNHLQYAVTWFGIAAALVGVFAAFAWQRLRGDG